MAGHSHSGFSSRAEILVPSVTAGHPDPDAAKQPRPSHYPTVFDYWYDVLFMKCCVNFMLDEP